MRLLVQILCLSFAMGCTFAPEPPMEASRPPNIVLLVSDDQRQDFVGFRHPVLETPHLDRLAASGVWFEDSFVTTPICSASRASLLTGLHERTHGHRFQQRMPLGLLQESFPHLLRNAGYRTAFIGKNGTFLDPQRQRMLFDSYEEVRHSPVLADRGHGLEYRTDYMARRAVSFLEGRDGVQPFLLMVSFHSPHAEDRDPRQYIPPPRYESLYQGVDFPPPPLSQPEFFAALPGFLQENLNRVRWHWRWTPELADSMLASYLAMVRGVDDAVGEILAALQARELVRNTVVIFTSDNGAFIGERGYAGKWLAYEASIRVPLIIADPRLPAARRGQVDDHLVANVDLAETILDLAGVPIPARMQGRSLRPLLMGEDIPWRTEVFLEHSWQKPPRIVIPPYIAVRTQHMKYIDYVDHQVEELYDLRSDPLEAVNLASDPRHATSLEALRRRAHQLCESFRPAPTAGDATPEERAAADPR